MRKRMIAGVLAVVMVLATSVTAFAGSWKQDAKGWQWDYGNGTKAAGKWEWCDGNGDGVAECYYFDGNGYCLMNTTTPDGYTVNKDGAWTVNGVVQTKNVGAGQTAAAVNSGADRLMYLKMYYGLPGETEAQKNAKMQQVFAMGRTFDDMGTNRPLTCAAITEFLNKTDWPNMSEYDRAKAVYERVGRGFNGNVYGVSGNSGASENPLEWSVLVYKHGICDNYAREYAQLAELVGLQSAYYRVSGEEYGARGHALAAVKIDGTWYLMDPTNEGSIGMAKRLSDDQRAYQISELTRNEELNNILRSMGMEFNGRGYRTNF